MIRTEPQSDPHPPAAAVAAKRPCRCTANAGSEPRWRIAAMILLAGLAALMLGTFLQYGVTWDEEFQRNYGEVVLRWYTSLFRDRAALVDYSHGVGEISHYYGAAFDLVAQAAVRLSPMGPYETRHLVNVFVALAGVVATFRLGALLGGARSGVLAAVLLAATPAYYGHAFNNPKDIPFAALHAWVLVLALESAAALPRVPIRRVLALGVAVGLALGVRVGGAFVFGYVAVAWGATLSRVAGGPGLSSRAILPAATRLTLVIALAWIVLLLSWPAAQASPFARPLEALLDVRRTGTIMPVLFDGQVVLSRNAPRSYLPTWMVLTLPETWFVAGAAALVVAARSFSQGAQDRRHLVRVAVLGLAVLFPVVFAVLTRPNLFDAWRHFLFVAPPLAALAAHGFARFTSDVGPRPLRFVAALAAGVALMVVVVDMVRLHPYQTVYFNRLVAGGLPGANGAFETDYWGATYREGIEWLLSHGPAADPDQPVRVANCSRPFLTAYPLSRDPRAAGFMNVGLNEWPAIVLATTRFNCAGEFAEAGWRPIHSVERMGVPLLYVLRAPGL